MNHYTILRTFLFISFDFYEYTSSSYLSTWSEPGIVFNLLLNLGVSTTRLSITWCSATATCACLCVHFASFLGICLSTQCLVSFSGYGYFLASFVGLSSARVPGKLISYAGDFPYFFRLLAIANAAAADVSSASARSISSSAAYAAWRAITIDSSTSVSPS